MAFGTERIITYPKHKKTRGTYLEVAVKCWFTSTGRSMPLMMKVQTAEEEILIVDHIRVRTCEKQFYAGIPNWKYHCYALIENRIQEFTLLFCPEDCSWKLQI